jgi:predicted nucleic-acid-binding protein
VEAFDTNVVVRLLVRDDEEQFQRAEAVVRQAVAAGGAWPPAVVVVEATWVLRVAYTFDRATTVAALRRLVNVEGVVAEDGPAILRALDAYETGPADLADYVILYSADRAGASPLWTFDARLARAPGAKLVP